MLNMIKLYENTNILKKRSQHKTNKKYAKEDFSDLVVVYH